MGSNFIDAFLQAAAVKAAPSWVHELSTELHQCLQAPCLPFTAHHRVGRDDLAVGGHGAYIPQSNAIGARNHLEGIGSRAEAGLDVLGTALLGLGTVKPPPVHAPRIQTLNHPTCSAAPFKVSSLRYTPPLARSGIG